MGELELLQKGEEGEAVASATANQKKRKKKRKTNDKAGGMKMKGKEKVVLQRGFHGSLKASHETDFQRCDHQPSY